MPSGVGADGGRLPVPPEASASSAHFLPSCQKSQASGGHGRGNRVEGRALNKGRLRPGSQPSFLTCPEPTGQEAAARGPRACASSGAATAGVHLLVLQTCMSTDGVLPWVSHQNLTQALVSAQVLALQSQPRVWAAMDSFSGDNFSQAEHN